MKAIIYALCTTAMLLACTTFGETETSGGASMFFVIQYSPGKAWQKAKSVYEQELLQHGEYMQSLFDKGVLLTGGPFTDNSGGLAIIEVANEKEAKQVLEGDPAITGNVFQGKLTPYYAVFLKKNDEDRSLKSE